MEENLLLEDVLSYNKGRKSFIESEPKTIMSHQDEGGDDPSKDT